MADSNKKKGFSQRKEFVAHPSIPQEKALGKRSIKEDSKDVSLTEHLSWGFQLCDTDSSCRWSFCEKRLGSAFWAKIMPKLMSFETMTVYQVFYEANSNNHAIAVSGLQKDACDRLDQLNLSFECIYSLRLEGKIRLYGNLEGSVFQIIWYDDNHGDNDKCVCRSYKKHT